MLEGQGMFERFFNYAGELFCIADFDGRFIEVNDAFVNLLGYSKEELTTKKFLDFIHPDDLDATLLEMKNNISGDETNGFENRYIDIQGNRHVLNWRAYPDVKSGVIYAIARDVTAERAANNNFQQLEKALRDNIIFAKTDIKGRIKEVNDKFCEISGYERSELIGKTHKVVNSGEHDKSFFNNMWKTISSGKVWTGAITNRNKEGNLYFVESIIAPIYKPDGEIDSYIAIRFDITERIEYKAESAKILNILNETGRIAKVGGWELEVETGILSWTDETFKILGVEKKESQSPVLPEGLELFTDEYKPIIDEAVARGITHGESYALELQALTPQGDVKWIFTDGKPNYKDGKIVTLSGTIQDIHDKKITELKYNKERQKSIQSSKFAALGELSASIAHEINNPLGIISGYAELLKYKGDGSNDDQLDAILKSTERISYIVKNLKRFSRTDGVPTKQKVELIGLIEEALSLVTPKIKRSLIKFNTELTDTAEIWGNEVEIEQVIINLINNSIDAVSLQENSWVKLSAFKSKDCVELTFEDSGEGIPEHIQLKMFEPFFTTKDVNKGTGLGLSVVKGIIDEHNATIEVDNSLSNTCIRVKFNLLDGEV